VDQARFRPRTDVWPAPHLRLPGSLTATPVSGLSPARATFPVRGAALRRLRWPFPGGAAGHTGLLELAFGPPARIEEYRPLAFDLPCQTSTAPHRRLYDAPRTFLRIAESCTFGTCGDNGERSRFSAGAGGANRPAD
jgi:hypothetical protein